MEDHSTAPADRNAGLMAGVAGFARNGLGLLVNRIELAALELAEVRNNMFKLVLVAALGAFAAWFAMACLTALIVVLSWQALGWKILLIVAAVYTAIAAGVFLYARSMLKEGKLSMSSTLAELRSDRDALMK